MEMAMMYVHLHSQHLVYVRYFKLSVFSKHWELTKSFDLFGLLCPKRTVQQSFLAALNCSLDVADKKTKGAYVCYYIYIVHDKAFSPY